MSDLRIQLTKRTDGSALLRCVRADGTATWQRHDGPRARFFPLHDLAHYAVETALGAREGFFGLVAAGWDIAETDGKHARGPLPSEAVAVEQLVGMLGAEGASGATWTAAEFAEQGAAFAASHGLPAPRPVTDDDLARVRRRLAALHARWALLPAGGTLDLPFPTPPADLE